MMNIGSDIIFKTKFGMESVSLGPNNIPTVYTATNYVYEKKNQNTNKQRSQTAWFNNCCHVMNFDRKTSFIVYAN